MVHRKRTHRKRGGEIVKFSSSQAETKYLQDQAKERRKSLDTLGDRLSVKPVIVEGEGTGTRKPYVSPFQEQLTMRARANSAGRRRRHKRKHTRRRR